MSSQNHSGESVLGRLYELMRTGEISRRDFMQRALALGVAAPVATFLVNSISMKGASAAPASGRGSLTGSRQDILSTRPQAPDDQVRGAGGELKILQWQGVTTLSIHNAQGTKDQLGGSLISEPLLSYLPDGSLWPTLVKEVPTVENGGLSEDLRVVTYHLLEGVKWNDGEPFTSADVAATYEWNMDPANGSVSIANFEPIEKIETPDDLTVVITLKAGTLAWYTPFTGSYYGAVYAKHIIDQGDAGKEIFRTAQVGTGPYKIETFRENDQAIYTINEHYREPNKPYFTTINIKGGGDAVSAARAVLETGDWNVAWNLQVEPAILNDMVAKGKGQHLIAPGTNTERISINFSDPNKEVDGQRSEVNTPHPFLTDLAVRQALNYATDRDTISKQFYSGPPGEPPTGKVLVGIPVFESPNGLPEFDLEKAKQTLEDAGWVMDGDVRTKDGVALKMVYATTINAVRQKTQAVNKKNWESVGFKVELQQIDAGIFFDSSAGNDQNLAHFYRDVQMYTNGASSPYPLLYMGAWYSGNINQKSNNWGPGGDSRWHNDEYDQIFESLNNETDPEKAAAGFIRLNDIMVENVVIIPMVQRAAETFAITNNINPDPIAASGWETLYWNMANWNEVPQ